MESYNPAGETPFVARMKPANSTSDSAMAVKVMARVSSRPRQFMRCPPTRRVAPRNTRKTRKESEEAELTLCLPFLLRSSFRVFRVFRGGHSWGSLCRDDSLDEVVHLLQLGVALLVLGPLGDARVLAVVVGRLDGPLEDEHLALG